MLHRPLVTPYQRSVRNRIEFIFKGGKTKRFHTADTATSQTVAEHSFGVAWLVMVVFPAARKELILAALSHDLAEHLVGDVSSPTKRKYPALKAALDVAEHTLLAEAGLDYESGLSNLELKILKLADMLDGMLYCIRERKMGSTMCVEVYNNFHSYVQEFKGLTLESTETILIINQMWEDVHNGSK